MCGQQWTGQEREEWRSVPVLGYERYSVSNRGRVRGVAGRLIKQTINEDHYRYVRLKQGRRASRCFYVHRLVWLAFEGSLPEGLEIHHDDRNRANNCLGNLVGAENDAEHARYHYKARPELGLVKETA